VIAPETGTDTGLITWTAQAGAETGTSIYPITFRFSGNVANLRTAEIIFDGDAAFALGEPSGGGREWSLEAALAGSGPVLIGINKTGVERTKRSVSLSGQEGATGVPREKTALAILSPPDTTIYGRGATFDRKGLVVAWEYNDGSVEEIPEGGYTFTKQPDMTLYSPQQVEVSAGGFSAKFAISVMDSDKTLTGITVSGNYKTSQRFYSDFDRTGLVIMAKYSNSGGAETEENVTSFAAIKGYDKMKRGPQTVTAWVNGKSAPISGISARIPADMTVTITYPIQSDAFITNYKRVYLKGEEIRAARLNAKAVTGSGTVTLSYDNGNILDTDLITDYNPNVLGKQTPTIRLDDKDVQFDVAVVDAAPAAWFDYGYRRSPDDPDGKGPGDGKYRARVGETLALAPVRFLVGYDRGHNDTGATYSWSVSGGSFSSPASATGEIYSFTPTAPGTSTITVNVTGKSYITGEDVTVTATTQVECFNEVTTQQTTIPAYNLYHYAPGQYGGGGSGQGWSLGCVGGYRVWAVAHQSSYKISGNAFAAWVEPGVVWVQEDRNGNNKADEMWYELKGSEDETASRRDMITRRYAITFIDHKGADPILEEIAKLTRAIKYVYWVDSRGRADIMPGSDWDDADWPSGGRMTFTTTLLRDARRRHVCTQVIEGGPTGVWGYVDTMDDTFPINRAVRADGVSVTLGKVRFVKVQTSVFGYGGVFGDFSTEISSADYLGKLTDFPMP
jgi:hypothetical protein